MTDIQKELKQAFDILMQISVRGDDVEKLAMAKARLSRAWQLTGESREEEK